MLSGVVLTKNEEKNIESVINSLKFCDEILILDDYSTDQTAKRAKDLGARVIRRKLNNDFAGQRNFAIGESRGEWIFFVDADEEVSRELRNEILSLVAGRRGEKSRQDSSLKTRDKAPKAFHIKRRDIWWGRELKFGEVGKIRLLRLVKKNSGRWRGRIHETFKTSYQTATLKNYLTHRPHPTVREFLAEINSYSTIRARELADQGRQTNLFEIIFYPPGKFFLNYFLKLGLLDGAPGFVYAFMMSFHSFLVRAKLYTQKLS